MPSIKELRVASLLPSTTDILIKLKLQDNIVGVTHECDGFDKYFTTAPSSSKEKRLVKILTSSHVDISKPQEEVDLLVKTSLYNNISLYHLNQEEFNEANPTVILTQTLCNVCAVSREAVDEAVVCHKMGRGMVVLSLEPTTIEGVADSFEEIARACNVLERGIALKNEFLDGLTKLQQTVDLLKTKTPSVLILEWINPAFIGGHWVPQMVHYAGCYCVSAQVYKGIPSTSIQITFERIQELDPDVIIVACCGFDLQRNVNDALSNETKFASLRAFQNKRVYAADGNQYFARPSPYLLGGSAIIARCAFDDDVTLIEAIDALEFMPDAQTSWLKVAFSDLQQEKKEEPQIDDIEDLDFIKPHEIACKSKETFYVDPSTKFHVFTEYAHRKRGYCCGSGCRHCPFHHVNVKDKCSKIQQPSFLYAGQSKAFFECVANIVGKVKILFFSGGKDSYLALRYLVKQRSEEDFQLILLTTFDAITRMIAHQEIHISTVLKQAKHLEIPLLGVPLHRGSSEAYFQRVQRAIDYVNQTINSRVTSLCFGDLHLQHVRYWRDSTLDQLGYQLEYPVWLVPYDELLDELEKSGVTAIVSASTTDGVEKGQTFDKKLVQRLKKKNDEEEKKVDLFGEDGDFHSVVYVWDVSTEQALGLSS